jgi:short-subunit dehydrogenase
MQIGLLVANAAHAPVGPFLGLNGPEIQRALRVNCDAPVRLARTYLPLMVERRRGGFVVVSSAAGLQGSPDLVLYAATKAFGRILAEGLWSELRQARVDVIACIAGAVRTPGWEASGMRTAPGILSSCTVAAQTYDRLGRGPVFVPGRITWTATTAMRLLPRRTAVALMDRANRRLHRS